MAQISSVELRGVTKRYPGAERAAVDAVSLTVEKGAFFSILGPSGCGKTSLLRIIAGFEYPTEGRVLIDGRDVTALAPRERDIAMVFQDYALYPHMTAKENIVFNLRNKKVPKKEIGNRLAAVAEILGITALLDQKPDKLSGGERQRVALGRAIIRKPRVFLMDEPLSNLDLKLREAMRIELGRIHKELGVTMIFVTHDQSEAMTLSGAIAVIDRGRLQQCDTPDTIYRHPANIFVARFIGSPSMNLLRMRLAGGCLAGTGGHQSRLEAAPGWRLPDDSEVIVGVRPHQWLIARDREAGIPVTVELVEHLGRSDFAVCMPAEHGLLVGQRGLIFETDTECGIAPGDRLVLRANPTALVFFRPSDSTSIAAAEHASEPAEAGPSSAAGQLSEMESR
jgi:ABC-type sugar transport system ATPase subunit